MITLRTTDNPIVSILILTQDNLAMLRDCLSSIARTVDDAATPYELIVLFQQTSRRSVQSFLEGVHGVCALHARLNLGFGGGNNFAARYARGKYFVFLNDDTETHYGWLTALLSTAESDKQCGAVASRLVFPNGCLQEAGAIIWSDGSCYPLGRGDPAGSLTFSYVRPVHYASANGLLVPRRTFDLAGGFDSRYFPGYYEDVDLCMTIRHQLGQRIMYEPRSVVMHHESATSNRDPEFRAFLFRRHQTQFCSKWGHVLSRYPSPQPESRGAIERAVLLARGDATSILVVDDRVPLPGMGSGAGRTADLLVGLTSAGIAVTVAPTDLRHVPLRNEFAGLGIDIVDEPLNSHLQRSGRRYDGVIISRPHNFAAFHAVLRNALPDALVVYDVEALYHRRLFLQARKEEDPIRAASLEAQANAMRLLEMEIARSVDRLVAISEEEVEWLSSINGHAPIDFMRPLARSVAETPVDLNSRVGAVFVAGWLAGDESPNVGALQWYAREVLPRVRSVLPDFITLVTGSNPPFAVQALACEALVLSGYISSTASIYSGARVAVAPIQVGAGVKIKTIEALQYGVPIVATSVGAEGLGLSDGLGIDIADDPEEFARRVIAVVTRDDLWLGRRLKALEIVHQWEADQPQWGDIIRSVLREGAHPFLTA